jgi:hypothetical protein
MAVLYFGRTMSGRATRHLSLTLSPSDAERESEIGILTCRRKRYPILCSSERTIFSGVVSLPRMRDMFHERCCFDKRSRFTAGSLRELR